MEPLGSFFGRTRTQTQTDADGNRTDGEVEIVENFNAIKIFQMRLLTQLQHLIYKGSYKSAWLRYSNHEYQ